MTVTREDQRSSLWKNQTYVISTSSSFQQSIALGSMSATQLCGVCSALLLVILNQLTNDSIESYKGNRVTLGNLGLKCAGPALGTKYFIDEPCPYEATLDLDTARLFWTRHNGKRSIPHMTLDCRCVACHGILRMRRLLDAYDLEHRPDIVICTVEGCNRSTFCGSERCFEHLGNHLFEKHQRGSMWTSSFSDEPLRLPRRRRGLPHLITTDWCASVLQISKTASGLVRILLS